MREPGIVAENTYAAYETQVRVHILPHFGKRRLDEIKPAMVEDFAAQLVTQKTAENGLRLSQNSVRLALCVLRAMLAHARRNPLIESNPAAGLGETVRSEKPAREIQAMTRRESELFLGAVLRFYPDAYPLFLTALRAGLRLGELAALKWGDVNFGESESDPNRYILVQRNFVNGEFGTPKSGKSRRVDLSKQLRAVLMALRDEKALQAMLRGQMSIADELVFNADAGGPIVTRNIGPRFMEPSLEAAGLRHFNFHALRHTFAALLLQAGVSPAYVQRQMGHSSIKITVDIYGHWIPGENVAWIDQGDAPTNANQAQTRAYQDEESNPEPLAITGLNDRIVAATSLTSPYANPNLSL